MSLKHFSEFYTGKSLLELDREKTFIKWKIFLIDRGIKFDINEKSYFWFSNYLLDFIKDLYDDREETEKDIWYSKNIKGAKKSATSDRLATSINFSDIPIYYKDMVKRYFKTIITKKVGGIVLIY
ncbi:hypothetical protein [Clostridium magnum]|uniref:Uncharacterized protein n=1 Tax=Clostridium magnum DSM 2767 TaxID=1121326 RepID=A0A162QCF3_9CLOT|nr:hypothetical protein [Clostridium magnum]KZL88383.1 hypothetical protein CLMAG_63100 [Clostridium magnum DSM 2767]